MRSYLIETYVPRGATAAVETAKRRLRSEAEAMTAEGTPAHHVRTTFLPDDETCFHLVRAESAAGVEQLCRRARLGRTRIAVTVEA